MPRVGQEKSLRIKIPAIKGGGETRVAQLKQDNRRGKKKGRTTPENETGKNVGGVVTEKGKNRPLRINSKKESRGGAENGGGPDNPGLNGGNDPREP